MLLTGAAGYIGSHVCYELIRKFANIKDLVIVDNFSNSDRSNIEKLEKKTDINFYDVNICDIENLENIFRNYEFTTVIHFAAYKSVEESVKYPLKYYENNIVGLLNILKCMSKYNVKNLIFSSSATVYGNPKKSELPLTELSLTTMPINPYGKTKLFCEEICKDFKNINTVSLRYFNPVGNILSDTSKNVFNLFPLILQVIKGERENIYVYGDDYDTKDGSAVRDYVHIQDLARGHISALDYFKFMTNTKDNSTNTTNTNTNNFEIFNLGTGKGYSVFEIISEFEKQTGKSIKYIVTDRRCGDAESVCADSSKAKELLNWKTELNLSDMVRDTLNL